MIAVPLEFPFRFVLVRWLGQVQCCGASCIVFELVCCELVVSCLPPRSSEVLAQVVFPIGDISDDLSLPFLSHHKRIRRNNAK